MKPRIYLIILLFIIPIQARLLSPFSIAGITPDLALAVVYVIGILTTPREAALAGIGIGLLQDINAASYLGLMGFMRGLMGLSAGFLGKHVLNVASMSNVIFLGSFSLLESTLISLFHETVYGSVPFFSLFFSHMLPRAVYTAVAGSLMLRYVSTKDVIPRIMRRSLEREV